MYNIFVLVSSETYSILDILVFHNRRVSLVPGLFSTEERFDSAQYNFQVRNKTCFTFTRKYGIFVFLLRFVIFVLEICLAS